MARCGVLDTTPAPENNVAICPGEKKKKRSGFIIFRDQDLDDKDPTGWIHKNIWIRPDLDPQT